MTSKAPILDLGIWVPGFLDSGWGFDDLSQGRENEMRTDMELQTWCLTASAMNQGSPKPGPSPKTKVGSENLGRNEVLQAFLHLWWKLCNSDACLDYAVVILGATKVSSHKNDSHLSIFAKQTHVKRKGNTSFMDVIANMENMLWWYLYLCLNSVVFNYFLLSHTHKASPGFLDSLLPSSVLRHICPTCIWIWLNNHTPERNLRIYLLSP